MNWSPAASMRSTLLTAVAATVLVAALLSGVPPAGAAFPGTNGALVFQRDDGDIFRVDSDGTNVVRLTDSPAQDNNPQWSPDGTQILFNSDRNGTQDIFVMNGDGANEVLVYGTPALEFDPAWCPTSNPRGVFMSDAAGDFDIYSIADYANPTGVRLTDNPLFDGHPSCGQDVIVYQSVVETGNTDVFSMNLDGSNKTNLTDAPGFQGFASISPDGTRIAYVDSSSGNGEIILANVDGTNPVNLTNDPADDGDPAFSPDGSLLAFQTNRDGNFDVWFGELAPDPQLFLPQDFLTSAPNEYSPDWQPLLEPEVVEHNRTVTAELKKKPLRLKGDVTVTDGFNECVDGVPVELQKKTKTGWKQIDEATTGSDGSYRFRLGRLPRLPKLVRARTPAYLGAEGHFCLLAASPKVRVKRKKRP